MQWHRTSFSFGFLSLVWEFSQDWACSSWSVPSETVSKRSLWCKVQQTLETVDHSVFCVSQAPACPFIQAGCMQARAKHTPALQAVSPVCTQAQAAAWTDSTGPAEDRTSGMVMHLPQFSSRCGATWPVLPSCWVRLHPVLQHHHQAA